ncbi:multidrug effflux MFS transporter [Pseudoalteromonas tunicata]|nr:multidrug effflux MFS transporter [Pseudoalteromonas tunicata]ATC93270.1 MFS transporter, DHA1 family, bicyclomycin/chloramphenicol resistance protein [Pseudoalteromonas tunicata]AXT32327.1 Bcr/CflA family efflux MFS transporter [Pseudoalteromonas tunicata]
MTDKKIPIYLLILMAAIPAFSLDIYLPLLEQIREQLATSVTSAQMTISLFVISFAFIQLVIGPLSDNYGRKKVLYVGLLLFILGSLVAIFSADINTLMFARVLQGAGACTGVVSAFAIARDGFSLDERATVLATIGMYVALAPIIAPVIGGLLSESMGWRYIFLLLAVLSFIILLLVTVKLPETLAQKNSYKIKSLLLNYKEMLCHRDFVVFTAIGMCAFTSLFCFISMSPHIFINQLGYNSNDFGFIFAFNALVFFAGSKLSIKLSKTKTHSFSITLGLTLLISGGVVMALLGMYMKPKMELVLLPMALASVGISIVLPNATSLMLEPFGDKAASASALNGFIRFVFAGSASVLVTFLDFPPHLILAFSLVSLSVLSWFIWLVSKYNYALKTVSQ